MTKSTLDDETDPEEEKKLTIKEDDEDEAEEAEVLADDAEIEILIDGETHRASVKELKRLWGQETSLTRKSQLYLSSANRLKMRFKSAAMHYFQAMLQQAEERFKPYSEVDMLLASKTMDAEDFAALRKEAQSASGRCPLPQGNGNQYYGELQKQHQAAQKQAAAEAVKVLQDAIPDWSE